MVLLMILNSLSLDLFDGSIYGKTAFEMWNDLKETYDKFLMGLDVSYLEIRSNILTREHLPLVKVDFVVVFSKESHRNVSFVRATRSTATAFVTKTFDSKRRYIIDRSFELVGYPAGFLKRNSNASTRPATSNNAYVGVHSNNNSTENRPSNSLVSLSNKLLARLIINVVDISNLGLTVGHPNGTQDLITKIEGLNINYDITLYDVLVVREYTISLFSIHKVARDSKLFVRFDETKCYI
ncbi:hypothetical protein Tco_0138609 [Tanacetum coccineum]